VRRQLRGARRMPMPPPESVWALRERDRPQLAEMPRPHAGPRPDRVIVVARQAFVNLVP